MELKSFSEIAFITHITQNLQWGLSQQLIIKCMNTSAVDIEIFTINGIGKGHK